MSQRGTKKSRMGCLACKSRRTKCDELRPECGTCTRRGHRCPGYQQPLKWSTKYELSSNATKTRSPAYADEAYRHEDPPARNESSSTQPNLQYTGIATVPMSTSPMSTSMISEPNALDHDCNILGSWDSAYLASNSSYNDSLNVFSKTGSTTISAGEPRQSWLVDPIDWATSDRQWLGEIEFSDNIFDIGEETRPSGVPLLMPPLETSSETEFATEGMTCRHVEERQHFPEDHLVQHVNTRSTVAMPVRSGSIYINDSHSTISPSLPHMPTLLIDYWFRNVCGVWNGFDSEKNMNRRMAMETFAYSEGLAYSLQSMAAAHLAEHLPHFRGTTVAITHAAIKSIREELTKPQGTCSTLPCGLLLSMFCIGTSACWTDPLQTGLPFLKEIKAILRAYDPLKVALSREDSDAWTFFDTSRLYWDMMCSIIDKGADDVDKISRRSTASVSTSLRQRSTTSSIGPTMNKDTRMRLIHPWTGVSDDILILFSESISLCRRFRTQMTHSLRATSRNLKAALAIIQEAQELHRRLRSLYIPTEPEIDDTDDALTPKSHLVQIAEAYRLASILHLTHTFEDLHTEDDSLGSEESDVTGRSDRGFRLGLEIISILEHIPITSGSRCLQPLLCLTAGIVLRLEYVATPPDSAAVADLHHAWTHDLRDLSSSSKLTTSAHGEDLQPENDWVGFRNHYSFHTVSQRAVDISHARRFILQRFGALESSLPSKPIRVAKQLVQAVWAAHDAESSVCTAADTDQVHWIDVMTRHNLMTIFG